ncbi:MAG: flagellar protein FlaG, partial [Candidatus Competibacteraceae bacterium]|nr:flagellar protein FlaG [Candidatus Competibacteraceae bacterium]
MTSNITAVSSALPNPVSAEPRPRAGADEKPMHSVQNANDAPAPSGATSTHPEPLTVRAITSSGVKPQDAKFQDAKPQDSQLHDPKALALAVDELNQRFKTLAHTHLQFTLDEKTDQVVVKVMDS